MYDFSVIIPTHNRSVFLQEAVESVLAQQVQVELIIVDDVSTDDTPKVVQNWIKNNRNIVYLRNESSLFAQGSRKRGYLAATGRYVVFMDDDDYYIDNHFLTEVKAILDNHTQVNTVLGTTVGFCDGRYERPVNLGGSGIIPSREYFNGFGEKYTKPQSTLSAVFRKEALDKVELAESEMINDTCIYLWGTLNGDVYLLNKPVAAYRFHGSNISNSAFSFDFILATLNEKNKIYQCAQKANLLENRKAWLSRNLGVSIIYFIQTNKHDVKSILGIFLWVMRYGHGVQFLFLKKLLKKIFHKK